MKHMICMILTAILFLSVTCFAFADTNVDIGSAKTLTPDDLKEYQKIIDRLNEEYGYSVRFDDELFSENHPYHSPTEFSLSEFEAQLRKDIEFDIAVNNESAQKIAALGDDVVWHAAPFSGKYYELPGGAGCRDSQLIDNVRSDLTAVDFRNDIEQLKSSVDVVS